MLSPHVRDIYHRALSLWGEKAQVGMVHEEIGELLQAMNKVLRGKDDLNHLAEEIADCQIMLEQLAEIIGKTEEVFIIKMRKFERLESKVIEHEHRDSNRPR